MLRRARPLRRPGPDQAEPAGEVPPGRGVPAAPGHLDHRRARQGPPAPPTAEDPLRIVDLGCGNAYLTFAAQRFLTDVRGAAGARHRGRRASEQSRDHNARCRRARWASTPTSSSARSPAPTLDRRRPTWCSRCTPATPPPTTRWPGRSGGRRRLVLAAPCCHHDIAAQLRTAPHARAVRPADPARHPARALRRHPHRRAARLAAAAGQGYRVDVVQFVESQHTPRNTMLRAVRTGAPGPGRRRARGVRRARRHVGRARRRLAELLGPGAWLIELLRCLGGLAVVGALRHRAAPPPAPAATPTVVFRFQDPEIVESSGLVARRRPGRHRPTTPVTPAASSPSTPPPARPSASPSGPTGPTDVEALRPGRRAATCGSATSATTPARATRSRSRGCPSARATGPSTSETYRPGLPRRRAGRRDAARRTP